MLLLLLDYATEHWVLKTRTGQITALFVVYLLAGWLGLSLAFFGSTITLIWPPTGLAIGVLVLRKRLWPGVFLGAVVLNLITSDYNIAFSLLAGVGNTLEGFLGAYFLQLAGFNYNFKEARRDFWVFMILGVALAPTVSALIGNYGLMIGGMSEFRLQNIVGWWTGDAVGAFFIAPLIWAWQSKIDQLENQYKLLLKKDSHLEEAYRDVSQFPYIIAHDLQSPLTTIQGFLGVLTDEFAEYGSEDILESLSHMKIATENARNKITALLEFSGLDSAPEDKEQTSLCQILDNVLISLGSDIESSKAVIHISESLPTWRVNKNQIATVFENLITNSIKYHRPGVAPRIFIGLTPQGNVFVRDNGIGIPEHLRFKAFSIFGKVSKESKGQGMGLAICRRIIDRHGGRIWIDDTYEDGLSIEFNVGDIYENSLDRGRQRARISN